MDRQHRRLQRAQAALRDLDSQITDAALPCHLAEHLRRRERLKLRRAAARAAAAQREAAACSR